MYKYYAKTNIDVDSFEFVFERIPDKQS